MSAEDAGQFRVALDLHGIACPLAHDSYLINLASPDDALWEEVDRRADRRGPAGRISGHSVGRVPPRRAYTTTSEAEGLKRIIVALDAVLAQSRRQPPDAVRRKVSTSKSKADGTASRKRVSVSATVTGILLETTAGQGTTLGWRFEHLAAILSGSRSQPPGRLLRHLPRLRRRVQIQRRPNIGPR